MSQYPSKEQIMKTPFKLPANIVWELLKWKEANYDKGKWNSSRAVQLIKLQALITSLPLKQAVIPRIRTYYCYIPETRTIFLDRNNPSILSTLHEIAHHVTGPDELEACRWSVWLFKQCFPKAFQKLEWKGHMLVKPYV